MIDNFPKGYTPTENQTKIFDVLGKRFKSERKFLILQAPTGTGKTFVSKTIANMSRTCPEWYQKLVDSNEIGQFTGKGQYKHAQRVLDSDGFGCYSLTITKALQNQYKNTFDDTVVLKGMSNYTCDIDANYEVDSAPCVFHAKQKPKCMAKKCCTYYNTVNDLLKSQFGCLNYSKFFSMPQHYRKRQYLVLDEASELESELVMAYTFELRHKDFNDSDVDTRKNFSKKFALDSLIEILQEVRVYVDGMAKNISGKGQGGKVSKGVIGKYKKYSNIMQRLSSLVDSWHCSDYICETTREGCKFTPLKVDVLAQNMFADAEKVILMSATIVGITTFAKTLGIKDTDYDYVNIESDFDPKKSPIRVIKNMALNRKNLDAKLPNVVKCVEAFMDKHENEKGLIHTHTHQITEYLKNNISKEYQDRLLIRDIGVHNEAILEEHMRSEKPTVLISPSMTYGIDLKDDLARWQAIVKLPYLPLNDERTRQMKELDEKWYLMKMINTLVQACGRTTRSKNDHSVTYIVDTNFLRTVQYNNKELTTFFLKRCGEN